MVQSLFVVPQFSRTAGRRKIYICEFYRFEQEDKVAGKNLDSTCGLLALMLQN